MEKVIVINGNKKLNGTVFISGSKNAGLAVLAAAVLIQNKTKIYNLPKIQDIDDFISIMKKLNVKIEQQNDYTLIDSSEVIYTPLVNKEVSKIRASYYFMGVCLGVFNEVEISVPGGCKIGERPIDQHLYAFKKMGVNVKHKRKKFLMQITPKHSTIKFEKVSVGATINSLLLACKINQLTILSNVSLEPEVYEVIRFLKMAGSYIKIVDKQTIIIIGRKNFKSILFNLISDRIEAGTYAAIAVATASKMVIKNVIPSHMQSIIKTLNDMGANIKVDYDSLTIEGSLSLKSMNIKSEVYPGFPTDLQQIFTTLATQTHGISYIEDTIYKDRLAHVPELIKMNADIKTSDNRIEVNGPTNLKGCAVDGKDLRGGASLVLAGLLASGESRISGLKYINRGYSQIVENLKNLGADIKIERINKK